MSKVFDCTIDNILLHLKNIFRNGELNENSVVEESSISAADGKKYRTKLYILDAIIANWVVEFNKPINYLGNK